MAMDNELMGQSDWQELFNQAGEDEEITEDNYHRFQAPIDFDNPNDLLEVDPDEEIYASLHEYLEFIKSNVWRDIKIYLEERIENGRAQLEALDNTNDDDLELKVRVDECKQLLGFPEQTINILRRRYEKYAKLNGGNNV